MRSAGDTRTRKELVLQRDREPRQLGSAIAAGQVLGPYRVEKKLAEGGMGEVFQAFDTRLERRVAIKVLPARLSSDGPALQRFEREGKVLAALSHPNILAIFDVGRSGSTAFAVTELLTGVTLREKLKIGRLPCRQVVGLGGQAARGLAAAHAEGIVHRDLKPENLFMTTDGQLKILDFGIATFTLPEGGPGVARSALTAENAIIGTAGYMAPEQAQGRSCDHRSDIFGLGCVLYEMLSGAQAFRGETFVERLYAVVDQEPPPLELVCPEAGSQVVKLIERCLAKDPAQRFQSASDLAFHLGALAEAPFFQASPQGPRTVNRRWLPALAMALGVAAVGSVFWLQSDRRPSKPSASVPVATMARSIAVLPFANLSTDPENEYFSDGLSEELLNFLAKIPQLRVCSRTSAFSLKGQAIDVATVGAKLNVEYVLEGSVRKADRRVRISAQLIEVASDSHLWSETYDRELNDVFAIQDDIANSVASALALRLTTDAASLSQPRAGDIEVYNLYLKGKHFANRGGFDNMDRALAYYQQALERDPTYVLAWAGLASIHAEQAGFGHIDSRQGLVQARREAERALGLAPRSAEARGAMALVKYFGWDWQGAETEFRRALELDPANANILRRLALSTAVLGHPDEGLVLSRKAVEQDPLNPSAYASLSFFARVAGRLDEAEAVCRKWLELDPDSPGGHMNLGLIYLARSRNEAALSEMEQEKDPPRRRFGLALAYFALGRQQEADAALAELIRIDQKSCAAFIAVVFATRGQNDEAFAWLERARAQHDVRLSTLKVEPLFRSLEGDPRFEAMIGKLALPS